MARLTRDFSGKQGGHSASHAPRSGRLLAYHHKVMDKRTAGERVGLLLVSVDDWHGGEYFVDRPSVDRVVATIEHDLLAADWSVVAGLDCLVCGDCDAARFDTAVLCCMQAGAASVWGEFECGMVRLEFWRHAQPYFVSASRPVPADRFGNALASFRDTSMLLEDGFYGHAAFAPMRSALIDRLLSGVSAPPETPAFRNCFVLAGDRREGIAFAKALGFVNLEIVHIEDVRGVREISGAGHTVHVLKSARQRPNYDELLHAALLGCRVQMEE